MMVGMKLYTSTDAAAAARCTPRTILRVASRHGIGQYLGHVLVLTQADVRRLQKLIRSRAGNPTWNVLGKKSKIN